MTLPTLIIGLLRLAMVSAATVSPARLPAQPPVLVSFAVVDSGASEPGRRTVWLQHRVVGIRPTQYRVSSRADFSGAVWQAYEAEPRWSASMAGLPGCAAAGVSLRLFFQVRAELGQQQEVVGGQRVLRPVTVESNVLSGDACLPR
jgi:hypothetical protein